METAEGPDDDRFLVRDLATLAREFPKDLLPDAGSGVSGTTGSSSSSLSSDSSNEKAETSEEVFGTAERDR